MTEAERVAAAIAADDRERRDAARPTTTFGPRSMESVDRNDRIPGAESNIGHSGHPPGSVNSVNGFPDTDSATTMPNLDGWDEPLSIEAPPLPAFPTAELGPNLAPVIEAVAEQFQVPVDLAAMTVLGVISASVGGRRRIKVREGWDETTSVWTAAVAGSSELKSPVVRMLAAPVEEAQRQLQADQKDQIEALEQERRIEENRMKAEEARAGNATDAGKRATATAEAQAARKRLSELGPVPKPARIVFGDLTPEVAAKRCAEQGGRLAILSAEGGTLEMLTGGYSKDQPNINFFLNAYSGDAEPVDRITRDTIVSDHAHVAMALLFQPAVLDGLARQHNKLRGKGLFGRFLFSYPVSRVGSRAQEASAVPADLRAEYNGRIRALIYQIWDTKAEGQLVFTPAATKVLITFKGDLEPRLGPRGDLRTIGEWAGKLAGNCARVAALLALFDNPAAREVDDEYVTRAVNLARYFIRHAQKIYELMGRKDEDDTLDLARDVLSLIKGRAEPLESFTRRDVQRALGRHAGTVEEVQAAIDYLAENGWVAAMPVPERSEGQRGRPPLPQYDVHPWCGAPPATRRNGDPR